MPSGHILRWAAETNLEEGAPSESENHSATSARDDAIGELPGANVEISPGNDQAVLPKSERY
jgi:hypothetical protein